MVLDSKGMIIRPVVIADSFEMVCRGLSSASTVPLWDFTRITATIQPEV